MKAKILASDFEDNQFMNCNLDMKGCPITKAILRATGQEKLGYPGHSYNSVPNSVNTMVRMMFEGFIPIQDFEFELGNPDIMPVIK